VKPFAEKLREELRRWVLAQFDEQPGRIEAARQSILWLHSTYTALDAELRQFRSATADNLLEFRREITIRSTATKGEADGLETGNNC
jgi:hypothetical protein